MNAPPWDFGVIGSGAAGSAVAGRLAGAGARALLIEQGEEASPTSDAGDAVAQYYSQSGLTAALGPALLPIPIGISLGGTTTINSGTCMRPPDALITRWAGPNSPSYRVDPFKAAVEEAWNAVGARRAKPHTASRSTTLFFEGLERLGIEGGHYLDRAEDGCEGLGRCRFVCPSSRKTTADKAFLSAVRGSGFLTLMTSTKVVGIDSPARGPVSLFLRCAGRKSVARCRTLVISAGALASPHLVSRARLSPAWREAGRRLSLHPAAKVRALFEHPVNGERGVPQGAGLVDPEHPEIRYEGAFTPKELGAVTLPLEGRRLRWWMERYENLATFGYMIRDISRGAVGYPLGGDLPVPRYQLCDHDLALMVRGMRFLAKTFFAAGASRVLLPLWRPDNVVESVEELEDGRLDSVRAGQLQMTAFHPLGTCGMGRVVDGDLKAGENVYVCDGSVVPESLGVNPQITIYAFALRLAKRLLLR